MKILFVCTGNTCRSPMAECIGNNLAKKLGIDKKIQFESAGLVGPAGVPLTSGAKKSLKQLGIKAPARKSKVIDYNKLKTYSLIITMTDFQKQKINLENCFSMLDFCGFEIADPYLQSEEVYFETAKQIEAAIKIILNKLLKKGE